MGCEAWAGADEDEHVMLFSGRDIWRNGAFAYGGFIFAPGALDQDGLLFKVLLSGGLYRYDAGNLGGERVIGAEWLAQLLPGWRIKRGDAEFKVFMGPDIQNHRLRPDDHDNKLRGRSFGLRMAAEMWIEPSPATMIAADVSLSSIATSNSARAAYGWRVFDEMLGGVYVGPEVQYFGSEGYRQVRFGAHVTSMKIDDVEWSAALGWARDSDGRSGPYLRLNVLKRR
jgi:hypothetical protein